MLCIIKQVFFMVVIFERRKNAGGCRKARIISLLHILLLNTKVAMVLSFRNVLIKYTQQGQSMTFLFNAIIALCIHRNIPCRVCVLSIGKSLGKCDVLIIFQSSYPSQIRVRIIMQCCIISDGEISIVAEDMKGNRCQNAVKNPNISTPSFVP